MIDTDDKLESGSMLNSHFLRAFDTTMRGTSWKIFGRSHRGRLTREEQAEREDRLYRDELWMESESVVDVSLEIKKERTE